MKTTREQAIAWWRSLHEEDQKFLMEIHQCLGFLYRKPHELTGLEIEEIFKKETKQ